MKENSAAQELIMDDKEDMTLSQLATCQIGNNDGIATGVLSTSDCDRKKSDESDELNDDTNDDIEVNRKTEEHLSDVEIISYSESIGNDSEKSSAHEEVAASDEGNIQDKGKYTDEDAEEELCVTGR